MPRSRMSFTSEINSGSEAFRKPSAKKQQNGVPKKSCPRVRAIFHCKFCDYSCPDNTRLRTHEYIHTGEKPYSCQDCDYRSTCKSNLRIHQKTHVGDQRYRCVDCNYGFNTKLALTAHLKRHPKASVDEELESQGIATYGNAQGDMGSNPQVYNRDLDRRLILANPSSLVPDPHEKVHKGSTNDGEIETGAYKCPLCEQISGRAVRLLKHMASSHAN